MIDGLVRRPEGVGSALRGFGSHRGSPGGSTYVERIISAHSESGRAAFGAARAA